MNHEIQRPNLGGGFKCFLFSYIKKYVHIDIQDDIYIYIYVYIYIYKYYIRMHVYICVSDHFCWHQASLAQLEMENPQLEDCVFFLRLKLSVAFFLGGFLQVIKNWWFGLVVWSWGEGLVFWLNKYFFMGCFFWGVPSSKVIMDSLMELREKKTHPMKCGLVSW